MILTPPPIGGAIFNTLSNSGVVNSLQEDFDQNQFTADLQPMFIQHARLEAATAAAQDLIIPQYLAAAVAAAEDACMRDVWLRQRAWECIGAGKFEFRRGKWTDVACTQDGTDVTATIQVVGDHGPKAWGFSIAIPSTDGTFGVTATTGYATLAEVPVDMVSFILAAAAWMYEMREIATYTTVIQHATVIPLYLLDTWTIPTYA